MTAANHTKAFKQLKKKPAKLKKFVKHNAPKKRSCGINKKHCKLCGRTGAHLSQYELHICRQCFRQHAKSIGFKQYS